MKQKNYNLDVEYTRQRLKEWGYWCNRIITMGLGYPNMSMEGKLIASGGVIIKATNPSLIPQNTEAEEINHLVNMLGNINQKQAYIINIHYTSNDSTKNKIKKMRLAPRTYHDQLNKALLWINQQLKTTDFSDNNS